jgi:hypothetical protein
LIISRTPSDIYARQKITRDAQALVAFERPSRNKKELNMDLPINKQAPRIKLRQRLADALDEAIDMGASPNDIIDALLDFLGVIIAQGVNDPAQADEVIEEAVVHLKHRTSSYYDERQSARK